MKKHIHFILLVLGTVFFLMTMRMYTAPLKGLEHDYTGATPATMTNALVMDINIYNLHSLDIVKGSFKVFAIYLAFVVIVFAHRTFYGSYRTVDRGGSPA